MKCKIYSHFFNKNISLYAIFNDQSFNDTLTNDIVSFEQLGPGIQVFDVLLCFILSRFADIDVALVMNIMYVRNV